ncbi:MAG: NAD(P)/FAD-dependent oxidoreductase [Clostridia bacterium]|nr:NAD(P)/FAD-dependent oxidoreductase [Clostridia bacterium]
MNIIVIGGGAAGMMAAAQAAMCGASVTLIEKNEKTGKKIYITGKGRCNVTNDCSEAELLENVVRNPRFLYSAVNSFNSEDLKNYIEANGVPLKVERGNRVFPVSDKSSDIIKALNRGMENAGVKVLLNTEVKRLIIDNCSACGVLTSRGEMRADAVILTTGGCSYPQTGSDGKGFELARQAGHTVTKLTPALVPINTSDSFLPELQGLSLKNVRLCAQKGKKLLFSQQGEMLFTHFGISGPLVLTMSSTVPCELISELDVYIDLKPALSMEQLDSRIIKDMLSCGNKRFKNSLTGLAPSALQGVLVSLSGIDPNKRADQLSREERTRLASLFKHFTLNVSSFRGFNEAIITRGGVELKEINSSTMESKITKGLYFAGEMLDTDAFTGGFNLQIAFSTGYLAGVSAAQSIGGYNG